ncbi:MAG: N-acetyl-gamma-glutamyl-phosphate reductase [Planctomycetales bacterium]|nr:N-acetyl-gamma-glutamyl-phosphate reductase [Planctomycetales bacterium]MCA9167168.1 N-acetyl-gamma-glutamyl-phosphate reductase [Planctomycetales bacterium]
MIRVGVIGATGYTGLELLKLLLRHPEVQIVALTSRQAGQHIAEVHPQLAGRIDLHLENIGQAELAGRCDCVFSCLPHAASAEACAELLSAGTRVVDFSADYRLNDVDVYEKWYATTHPDPARLPTTPYGLPEFFAADIVSAPLVANPGCYPTSAIMGLGPLLQAGAIATDDLIIDSKSGVSGGGRTPKLNFHFPECNENFSAYGVGKHRHTPEIVQILSTLAGADVGLIFTPHLVPMDRGILTTAYAKRTDARSEAQLLEILKSKYAECPFVRVSENLPATKYTAHTNFCDISLRVVGERVVVVSCIDNLIKGASGAAVQNMNLMFGQPQTRGLL